MIKKICNIFLIFISMIALSCDALYSSEERIIDEENRAVINILQTLCREADVDMSELPKSIYQECDDAIIKLIAEFLKKMEPIILPSRLEEAVLEEVDAKLNVYSLSPKDVPSSLQKKFNKKIKTILNRLRRSMWYENKDYVTLKEVKDEINREINYKFGDEIQDTTNDKGSSGWFF